MWKRSGEYTGVLTNEKMLLIERFSGSKQESEEGTSTAVAKATHVAPSRRALKRISQNVYFNAGRPKENRFAMLPWWGVDKER